jgi:cytochrome c oxidase subunit 2
MSSEDVLHSYYVPDFRIKKDVLPNRYTIIWFQVDELIEARENQGGIFGLKEDGSTGITRGLGKGEHQVYCTEYCGDNHSRMLSKVIILEQEDFDKWVDEQVNFDPSTLSMPERGKWLYKKQACVGCHSLDGTTMSGPSWKGLYNSSRSIEGGGSVTADDNYLRESIVAPAAKVVSGFAPQMPGNYKDLLDDDDIAALIEFIKAQN